MRISMFRYHALSSQETDIICHMATEYPGTGEYLHHFDEGIYLCKRCDLPLFFSNDKFISHCGWPSFDDTIENSIKEKLDLDGERTEVICSRCHAHLGHLFKNEGFTKKNRRYCINSLCLRFTPHFTEDGDERAIFAGGCFWGVEYFLKRLHGVTRVSSGYIGGHVVNPSYEEVCSETTAHAEAVEVIFNPKKISYESVCKEFLEIHDPTEHNRQGPDVGSQYRSAIFYLSLDQKQVAKELLDLLKKKGYKIETTLDPSSLFYPAESYHQNYYDLKGSTPYCHKKTVRF